MAAPLHLDFVTAEYKSTLDVYISKLTVLTFEPPPPLC